MALFETGNSGKPKGAVNKITQESRELFLKTIEGQVVHLEEAFKKVLDKNPAKYLELVERYMQYFIPKKVDHTSDENPLNSIPIISWVKTNQPEENKDAAAE